MTMNIETEVFISIVKLALMFALPLAAAIVWQRKSRAQWGSLFLGFSAYAVIGLVGTQLTTEKILAITSSFFAITSSFREFLAFPPAPVIWLSIPTFWIIPAFIWGLVRGGILWLILFFIAKNVVRTWKEGVMFGLGYSCLVAVEKFGEHYSRFSKEIEASRYSFVEAAVELSNVIGSGWFWTFYVTWLNVLTTAFNVGTVLVILFSVQRRNVWLLLAAVLWYAAFTVSPTITFHNFHDLTVFGIHRLYMSLFLPPLARTLVTLLPFLLLLLAARLRK